MVDGVIVSYKKLWKLMVDKGISKTELRNKSGVTTTVMSKLGKGEPVHLEALIKICKVLQCDIGDIVGLSFEDKLINLYKEDDNDKAHHYLETKRHSSK